jgi:hypothetical protein
MISNISLKIITMFHDCYKSYDLIIVLATFLNNAWFSHAKNLNSNHSLSILFDNLLY